MDWKQIFIGQLEELFSKKKEKQGTDAVPKHWENLLKERVPYHEVVAKSY